MKKKSLTINISTSTIIRTVLILLAVAFIYYILDIIVVLFISFIIISAITPIVDKLESKKIPRIISTVLIFFLVLFGFGYVLSLIIPIFISQFNLFIQRIPEYIETLSQNKVLKYFITPESINNFDYSKLLTENTLKVSSYLKDEARRLIYVAVMFSLSFYMTLQKNAIKNFVKIISPKTYEEYIVSLVLRIQYKMGKWLQGQLILNVIIGTSVYFILSFLEVPYALILAIIAGLFEFIPNIGPTFSTILAAGIALTDSPIKAIAVVISFIILQQLENHLIVPLVMRQAVGLNPVVIIIAIIVGIKLAWPIGAIIAVPFVTAMSEIVTDIIEPHKVKARYGFDFINLVRSKVDRRKKKR